MGDFQIVRGIKKLNKQQLQHVGTMHDVLFTKTRPLGGRWREWNYAAEEDSNSVLRKWKNKTGKAMFVLKITIKEAMLEHTTRG